MFSFGLPFYLFLELCRMPVTETKPVVDPTENVKDLVKEVVIRLDLLREAERRLSESELRRISEIAEVRASHAKELAIAEAKRIDAIRSVDVNAVAIANERAAAQGYCRL